MSKSQSGWRMATSELARASVALSERIDAAALAPARWGEVLEAICAIVPDVRVSLNARDSALRTPLLMGMAGWDAGDLEGYKAYYGSINPWNAAWKGVDLLAPRLSDQILPTQVLHKTEFYNDWLKPVGNADHASSIKLLDSGGRTATLGVHHSGARVEERHAILAPLIARLGPRLRSALLINRALALRDLKPPEGALMHSLMDPAFLLDETCRLLAANGPAEVLLRQGQAVEVGARDAFRLKAPVEGKMFAHAVKALCREGTSSAGGDFTFTDAEQVWHLSLLPVAPNSISLATNGALAIFLPRALALVILRTRANPAPIAGGWALPPGFTPAERRLVEALHAGGTVLEVAERLNIAYATARSQLKSIYAKAGVHSQRELMAYLLRTGRGR